MKLKAWIPCNPPRSTAQAAKKLAMIGGKPRMYQSKEGKAIEADFLGLFMPHRPDVPLAGPLRLRIHYCLPLLKSEKKAIKERTWTCHDRKPDADNLCKMMLDALGRLAFWEDDARIVHLHFKKYRSSQPGIAIEITEISEDEIGHPNNLFT